MDTSTSSQMVGDSLVLTFSYCNLGDNMLNAPYPITVFANTYGGDSLGTIIMSSNLPVDSCTQGEIHLAASDLCSLQGLNTLVVAVNCAGNGIAQNGGLQPECDTNNNTTNVTVDFLSVSVVMTEQACDSYTWNGTTYNTSGSYTASYTNEYGCDSIVTLQLTINPSVEIEDNLTLCENQLPYTYGDTVFAPGTSSSATFVLHRFTSAGCDSIVTLHLTINPTGLTEYYDSVCQNTAYSGYGFSLSEGETNTTGSHIFDHILTNQFGCDSIIRLHLYVKPVITPDFYADPDRAMLSESPMIHFVNNTNTVEIAQANYYWLWDFGDGTTDSTTEAETEHLYTQWGDYTVTLTLWADGCVDSSSVTVFIEADLEFPNVITPNGDGINDVFIIKNLNPDRPNKLYISDRWGKVVWNKDNYQTYMKDGQIYNAESGFGIGDLSDGVYYYAFYYEGVVRTIKFNGSITVIK
jgi:gliding motility-associated-like protein